MSERGKTSWLLLKDSLTNNFLSPPHLSIIADTFCNLLSSLRKKQSFEHQTQSRWFVGLRGSSWEWDRIDARRKIEVVAGEYNLGGTDGLDRCDQQLECHNWCTEKYRQLHFMVYHDIFDHTTRSLERPSIVFSSPVSEAFCLLPSHSVKKTPNQRSRLCRLCRLWRLCRLCRHILHVYRLVWQ